MNIVQRIFAEYGRKATLNGSPVQVVTKSTHRSTQEIYTPLGRVPQGQCTCYLPVSVCPRAGDSLVLEGEAYELAGVEAMKIGKYNLYWRVTAVKKGEADVWGM